MRPRIKTKPAPAVRKAPAAAPDRISEIELRGRAPASGTDRPGMHVSKETLAAFKTTTLTGLIAPRSPAS